MRIALITHGTRDDVHPFVGLAQALIARGHTVWLCVPANLLAFAQRCGVRADAVPTHQHREDMLHAYRRLLLPAELIVCARSSEDFALPFAEKWNTPLVSLHLAPFRATADFPNARVTTRALPFAQLNTLTHYWADGLWWKGVREDVNTVRAQLGLPKARQSTARQLAQRGAHTLHAFSPTLVTSPRDWGPTLPVLGRIRLPATPRQRADDAAATAHLASWLHADNKPVYFGLDSMPEKDPLDFLHLVSQVTHQLGQRALVVADWSHRKGFELLAPHIRVVDSVDLSWLLPQCHAAVHHGDANTVHAVAAAGLPTVVCSVSDDQSFWGDRLERLGVAVHLPYKKLTAKRLEVALRRVLDDAMQDAADLLAIHLCAEPDAMPHIVERLEQIGLAVK